MSPVGTSRKCRLPGVTTACGSKADSGKPSNGVFMSFALANEFTSLGASWRDCLLRRKVAGACNSYAGPRRRWAGTLADEAANRDALAFLVHLLGKLTPMLGKP
jgi:hypothetical protein